MLRGTHVSTADLIRLRGRTYGLELPDNPSIHRTGGFRSLILGRGMEYEKSRKYEAGDDVRMIDWRVTARTGTAHTKIFQEDRQKAVYLVVDLTTSMRFGTQVAFKSVVAVETAALLSWVANSHGDMLSIIGVTDDGVQRSKLAASSNALIKQLDMLAKLSHRASNNLSGGEQSASLADALAVIAREVRAGDFIVVLSDFAHLSDVSCKKLEYLSQRKLLMACWIQDRVEQTALPLGHYPVTDGKQFAALHVTSGGRRKKLQRLLDQRNQEVENMFRRLGITQVKLTCGDDVVKALHREFHRGAKINRYQTRRITSGDSHRMARTN